MPYCIKCGSEVGEEALFCPKCGHSLKVIPRTPTTFSGLLREGLISINPFRRPPPLVKPTDVVYEKLPPYSPVKKHLYMGLVLGVVGMFLIYGGSWLTYWGVAVIAVIAPLLYFEWIRRNDRFEKEPLSLIAFVIGWGIFCGIFAGILNSYFIIPIMGDPGAAFSEEILKTIGVYWLASHKRLGKEFNDHMDGMVYGAGAGAGFTWMEDFGYIYEYAFRRAEVPVFGIAATRGLTAFGHLVFTGLIGRILGVAKARRGYLKPTDLLAALPVGIILHFIWNALPGIVSVFILSPIYILIFYRNVKAASRDEELWGYRIRAPIEKR